MANALLSETSPYLLQHAHNPVDWRPWGDAAFDEARRGDRLVFLSVGYSTCHWCHVMERESFENEEIARVMNHHFVNVKVDREERPDIDATYMAFLQATTGQGGWPMSVWLTPEGRPVVAGTYFPPEDRQGRAGFVRVCHELARLWRDDRARLESSAARVMEKLRADAAPAAAGELPGEAVFGQFLDECAARHDEALGGFGGAPKFPRPVVIRTLLQWVERFGPDSEEGATALRMAERSLVAMAHGGIHDHLGGGFHRYSVDRWWHVPHYEKMLYDQGQLLSAYLEAWQWSGRALFRETAEGICRYLRDGLRDAGGAFHAAEDADSLPHEGAEEKLEGAYWTWEAREISALLEPADAALFCSAYGVEAEGNARPESDPHGELEGRNTLFRAADDEELAARFSLGAEEVARRLAAARETLLTARGSRPAPHRDDKILTAWNGLAIEGLARAGRAFAEPEWTRLALDAATFLRRHLWCDGRLLRSYRGQPAAIPAFPADHANLVLACIELHGADPEGGWLDWALELQHSLDEVWWDSAAGGYAIAASLRGERLLELREDYDGAEPAAAHQAALALLKLAALSGREEFSTRAETLLRLGSRTLEAQPFAAPVLLAALDLHQRGVATVSIPADAPPPLLAAIGRMPLPRAVFIRAEGREAQLCEGSRCQVLSAT